MLALAAALSIGIGVTNFGHQPENHWFQMRYPHKLEMTSPSVSLAYTHGNWRFHYTYVGGARSWALADPEDENYRHHKEAGGPCIRACRVHVDELPVWRGSGHMHAVGASYRLNYGRWFAEAGAVAVVPTWTQHVDGWWPHDPSWPVEGPPLWRADITVKHKTKVSVRPELNVGYQFNDNLSLVLENRLWVQQGGTYPPIFKHRANTLSLRYSF